MLVNSGTVIPSGVEIDQYETSFVLKEVDDPGKGEYSVGSSTPPSGSTPSLHTS